MRTSLSASQTMLQWFGGFALLLAFVVVLQGQRARNPQFGWEYLVVSHKIVLEDAMVAATQVRGKQHYFSKEAVNDQRLLDMIGKQGWELVNVEPIKFGRYQFIFKRVSF